jgi:hypothetical protein
MPAHARPATSSRPTWRTRVELLASGIGLILATLQLFTATLLPMQLVIIILSLSVLTLVYCCAASIRDGLLAGQLTWRDWTLYAATVLLAAMWGGMIDRSLLRTSTTIPSFSDYPLSAQLDSATWRALHEQRYEEVLTLSQLLIDTFGTAAQAMQDGLEAMQAPLPPIGQTTDSERSAVFNRGPLNSVATAYLLRGQALSALGRMDEAKVAYATVATFSYARAVRQENGMDVFWSPVEAAARELAALE